MKTAREKMDDHFQMIKHQDGRRINESMDRLTQTLQLELLEKISNTLDSLEEKFTSVLIDD